MTETYPFHNIARLPMPGDNVAIATRRLEQGTTITHNGQEFELDYTLLEGHRFAIQSIATGEALLSWGLPFGIAVKNIDPGGYVCNAGMLDELRGRSIDFELPPAPNFEDKITSYTIDEENFEPADPLPHYAQMRSFQGYRRSARRGVGTRNVIVLLGTSSQTGGFVKQLEARLKGVAEVYPNIDGIVAVAHTEGGDKRPNNLELVLRALAGFLIHPNVGAVLAVDYGLEPVNNKLLQNFALENDYPLDDVPHRFLSITGAFEDHLAEAEATVRGWLDEVNQTSRTAAPLSELKIALQCGGSDAFSGVSGNPLAAWVAKEVIRYGGWANLAETDELIGAEPYALQKVNSIETARKFLEMIARFKERVAWHGESAEGNPSGGNKFRGLYNISLKSIGAAMKRHPEVRLDGALEYGQRMPQPGYYFMDSPGNDLESIAGQVASGCNMIFFVTGNGSITNFPFVPTIKIVTTTQRYQLLSQDMDVNAGAYLDGTSMDELGQQTLELTIEAASGRRSVGEKAGHAQVQLWRDWQQTGGSNLQHLLNSPAPDGKNLPIKTGAPPIDIQFQAIRAGSGYTAEQVGLIMPTSLCAGQVGRMAAEHLNQKELGRDKNIFRFVSLVHTEGCGCSGKDAEELYARTLLGYLRHPRVKYALLLEHGCEKTHNDYFHHRLLEAGLNPDDFGWASIQLDGGIEKVMGKIEAWFAQKITGSKASQSQQVGLGSLRLGLVGNGQISEPAAQSLAHLSRAVVGAGGTLVTPEHAPFLTAASYLADTLGHHPARPSLAYGQQPPTAGFHIMDSPSQHWVEMLTGLGATGVDVILAYVGQHPMQGHPLLPVLQITAEESMQQYAADLDLVLGGDSSRWAEQILQRVADLFSQRYTPKPYRVGNVDFQITRGLLGVSM